MAVQTIVLYGSTRLYDAETYATNQDPESLSATLSDSMSMSDTEIQNAVKALAESLAMAEVWITSGNKALTESTTMTETLAKALIMHTLTDAMLMDDVQVKAAEKALAEALTIVDTIITTSGTKALAESMTLTEQRLMRAVKTLVETMTVADTNITVAQTKGLSEFILVKDWLELHWQKAEVWDITAAFGFAPSQIHLYGPGVYYGVDYYGANPSVNWLLSTPSVATWRNGEQSADDEPLYAVALYSQSLYGSIPAVGWTKPVSTAQQAWINFNGESHN